MESAPHLTDHQEVTGDSAVHESPMTSSDHPTSRMLGAVVRVIGAPLAIVQLVHPAVSTSENSPNPEETIVETRHSHEHPDDTFVEESGRIIVRESSLCGASTILVGNHDTNLKHANPSRSDEKHALHLPSSYDGIVKESSAVDCTHPSEGEQHFEILVVEDEPEFEIQKKLAANVNHAISLLEPACSTGLEGLAHVPCPVTEIPSTTEHNFSNPAIDYTNSPNQKEDQKDDELTIEKSEQEELSGPVGTACDSTAGKTFPHAESHHVISFDTPKPTDSLNNEGTSAGKSLQILKASAATGLHALTSLFGITKKSSGISDSDKSATSDHLEDNQTPKAFQSQVHETLAFSNNKTHAQSANTALSESDAHVEKLNSPSHEQMRETDFMATLAAGLEHTGFDTDLIIGNSSSIRHSLLTVSDAAKARELPGSGKVIRQRGSDRQSLGEAIHPHVTQEPDFDDIIEASLAAVGFDVDFQSLSPKEEAVPIVQSQRHATMIQQDLEENVVDFSPRSASPEGIIAAWNKGSRSASIEQQASNITVDEALNKQNKAETPQEALEEQEFAESLSHAATFMEKHANLDDPRLPTPVIPLKRSKARKTKKYHGLQNERPSSDVGGTTMRNHDGTTPDNLAGSEGPRLESSPVDDKLKIESQIEIPPSHFDTNNVKSKEEKHVEMPGFHDDSPAVARQLGERTSTERLSPALPPVNKISSYSHSGKGRPELDRQPVRIFVREGVRSLSASNAVSRSGTAISPPPISKGIRRVASSNVLTRKPLPGGFDFAKRNTTEIFSESLSPVGARRIASPTSSVISNRSGVLKRSDRSASGDLRAANKRDGDANPEADKVRSAIQTRTQQPENYHTLKTTEKDRRTDMPDIGIPVSFLECNVFTEHVVNAEQDLWRSSTRPQARLPALRKWDSMQIIDLENRLDQTLSENRCLEEMLAKGDPELLIRDLQSRDSIIHEKDVELHDIRTSLQMLKQDLMDVTERNDELAVANRILSADTNGRYAVLQAEHDQTCAELEHSSRELEDIRERHEHLSTSMEHAIRQEVISALAHKDAEIHALRADLCDARQEIESLQQRILAPRQSDNFLQARDEDYFDDACHRLCQHVQQWVLRFSKFSDMRACRLSADLRDEDIQKRLDNAILDGTDVDLYLSDRVKRRDVFMSIVMTMIWEFVFTRYLFGMDREQRSKLKSLEKSLVEVGMFTISCSYHMTKC